MSDAAQPSAIDRIRGNPALRSRDDSGVAAIAVGTLLWALALGAMLIAGTSISSALGGIDTGQWTLVCGIGFALGIPGLAIVLARRSRLRRRAQF